MHIKTFLISVFLLSLLFALLDTRTTSQTVEQRETEFASIERNVKRESLKERVNKLLSESRLPSVSIQPDGDYTIVSFPAKAVAENNLQCADVDFDRGAASVYELVTNHANENPFIQTLIQPNKFYTVLRLRAQCTP